VYAPREKMKSAHRQARLPSAKKLDRHHGANGGYNRSQQPPPGNLDQKRVHDLPRFTKASASL
jgi:hypothetical protein